MTLTHRLGALAAGLALASMLHTAHAAFPDKPVTMIVPFPGGGTTDLIARQLAEQQLILRELEVQ